MQAYRDRSARTIAADTALRLARVFGMDAQTWTDLQTQDGFETAEREFDKRIDKAVTLLSQAA
jgi:plasmid maintenance system antidote protein VapI